jgi:hypothetical protein
MTSRPLLDISTWAHHSWLPQLRPARSERARAGAAAHLFTRFPMLARAGATQLPWFVGQLERPACARLMRLCAALACARSLRLVVSANAHAQFSLATGLPPLALLQCHPRGEGRDLQLDAPIDCFRRRSLSIAGVALALRATHGEAQRLWMQLRMPRAHAEAAAQWRLHRVPRQAALDLVGDALHLLNARRTPC